MEDYIKLESLFALSVLIERDGLREFHQSYQGGYYKVDIVCLFNTKFGEISKMIKEGKLFYKRSEWHNTQK